MKKLASVLCLGLSVTLLCGSPSYASSMSVQQPEFSKSQDVKVDIKLGKYSRLNGFGFSTDEIQNMSQEDYKKFNEKYGTESKATLISKTTKYYRVKNGTAVEINRSQAESEIEAYNLKKELQSKGEITQLSTSDTETTSWLTMTTTASQYMVPIYVNGRVSGYIQDGWLLKNSFKWLTHPAFKLTDVLGMTFNPNLTYVQDSEFAVYTRDYSGVNPPPSESDYYYSAPHKSNSSGIAFDINLKAYSNNGNGTTKTHRGYMTFQVRKNNSWATSTNVYGHYSHLYNTINYSVSFNGDMSISGQTLHDDMSDTAISFGI